MPARNDTGARGSSSNVSAAQLRSQRAQRDQLEREADSPPGPALTPAAPITDTHTRPVTGLGRRLPEPLRRRFEASFMHDLSDVHIHDDHAARQQAEAENAQAYSLGKDVVLGADVDLTSQAGAEVLGHELTHVAQQQQPGAGQTLLRQRRQGGIGRRPPTGNFTKAEGRGTEDEHVLFRQDSASLDANDRREIEALIARQTGAVTVHVHGYASDEGSEDYNDNLSAHRAVRVKEFIERLLPGDSTVVAYARGETTEFGDPEQNRRVGIDVLETQPRGLLGQVPASGLPLDPTRFRLLDEGLTLRPITDIDLFDFDIDEPSVFDFPGPAPLKDFDSTTLGGLYSQRGLRFDARDERAALGMYRNWRDIYIRWGLNEGQAAWLAQLGTEKAIERSLVLEHPTPGEAFDLAHGTEPTTVVTSDMFIGLYRWLKER